MSIVVFSMQFNGGSTRPHAPLNGDSACLHTIPKVCFHPLLILRTGLEACEYIVSLVVAL